MRLKRVLKIIGSILLLLVLVLVIGIWMLSLEKYQNLLTKKATAYLSEKLKTKVSIDHVKLSFFNRFSLEGVYLEDRSNDTLAYVGELKVKTTELLSNYWNNTNPAFHDIILKDVTINLNRKTDSIWNYEFIAEAFSSGNDTSNENEDITKSSSSSKKPSPEIDLKKLRCKNVRFNMNDRWRGEDFNIQLTELVLNADNIQIAKKEIKLKNLLIDGADVLVREYDKLKPEDNSPDDSSSWGTPFNPERFGLTLEKLQLKNSRFRYLDGDEKPMPGEFNERQLDIRNINLSLNDTRVVDDTIFSLVEQLHAEERCGLILKNCRAQLKLSQVNASLREMHLETNHSSIADHFELNYRTFHDFNDFIKKVSIKASLAKSKVSSLDVGYFANILNQYPILVNVAGEFEGTVDQMKGKNIELATRNSIFRGNATVVGLPNIDDTYFDVTEIDLLTSGRDLNALIPQTQTDGVDWDKLDRIRYTGSYQGKVDQFYSKGLMETSLGEALLDLNMDFSTPTPSYRGHIETQDFQIGRLIKQSRIGSISMKGEIDGSAFDLDRLKARINATISSIELDGNSYKDMIVNGLVEKKKFDGIFISQDPGLALNFNGKLDLNGKEPSYHFDSRFIRFDLKKLGITTESVIGSGYASLNFTGSTLDNFSGTALVKNLLLESKGKTLNLDSVFLESYQQSEDKTLRLSSTVADAEVKGKFLLSGLPNAIRLYLHHYLPSYISLPSNMSNENLTYSVHIKQADQLIKTFAPQFSGISNSVISGYLNTNAQKFALDANILQLGYDAFRWDDLVVVGAGDYNEFDLNVTCGNVFYNDDVIIPSLQINGLMASDTASLSIITQSINELLGDAYINVKATALNNNLYVNILPSNFSIKEDKWQLHSNDDLVFGKRTTISNLILESGAQSIVVNSMPSTTNDLKLDLNELDLHSFSNYLNQTAPALFGRINGQLIVNDFLNHPKINVAVESSDVVRIDQDTLGKIVLFGAYDVVDMMIKIDPATKVTYPNGEATARGSINLKDSLISLTTQLSNTNISFVNQFINEYVKDLKGLVSGNVEIKGTLQDPDMSGQLTLEKASLGVIYLGTSYTIDEAKFNFTNRKITLEDFFIYDNRPTRYSALVKGSIMHRNFRDMNLNINVSSPNFLCLNTMEWDNELYYGYVPAAMKAKVTGHLDDIAMDIEAKPLKGANFHLPISSSGDASSYDYINFVEIGQSQRNNGKKKSANYFKINMNIEATPDAEVFIILDRNTREEIIAKGNGNINFNLDLGNSMNMFGTYTITEGKYEFNFRGLLPRTFTIDEGSQIRWNGDPLAAVLDVTAIYKLPNPLPLFPLIQNLTDDDNEIAEAKKKYDTYINLTLKNELSSPEIKFDITQPNNKAIGTLAYDKLVQIRNDEKELVSQAGVLLLLGEFKNAERTETGSYERGVATTASDLISNSLSSGLTNVFSEVTGLKNISLNMNYKTYSLNENQANINQFNFGISANLFKERVIVDFGSNVDVDRNNATTSGSSSVNVGGDFKAQYLVTDDGRLRLNAYRTSNYNAEGNNIMKGGLGLSYRKVFNTLNDFFTSKRKKNKKANTEGSS